MTRVDVLVAVRDEEANIPVFLEQIEALELPPEVALRVIFIEDSSTDRTLALLRGIAATNPAVGYCSLARSFGQGVALSYGLYRSRADASIMMDVDGSHPPGAIPEMIRRFLNGARVVQCMRRTLASRKRYRRLGAGLFHVLSRGIFGVDLRTQNIFYRLISAEVARQFLATPRYWRYLRFPLPKTPPNAVQLIQVDTVERTRGESKYGPLRLAGLALDGVLSMARPARLVLLGTLAAVLAVGALGLGLWPVALLVALGLAGLGGRYAAMGGTGLLARIEVLAASGMEPGES
ncbi:MAG: glycosyltransferase [Myxococcales bacterium]|nr:glycosyltransferase [Myxococcales bacterium]